MIDARWLNESILWIFYLGIDSKFGESLFKRSTVTDVEKSKLLVNMIAR